jgi:hypothetical protein
LSVGGTWQAIVATTRATSRVAVPRGTSGAAISVPERSPPYDLGSVSIRKLRQPEHPSRTTANMTEQITRTRGGLAFRGHGHAQVVGPGVDRPGQVVHGVGHAPQCDRPMGCRRSRPQLRGTGRRSPGLQVGRGGPRRRDDVDDDRPPRSRASEGGTGGEGCRRRLNRTTVVPALENEPHGMRGVRLSAGAGHQGAVDLSVPCRAQACSGSGSRPDVAFSRCTRARRHGLVTPSTTRPCAAVRRATRAQGDLGLPRVLSAHPVAGGPHGWPCSTWNVGGRFRA